MMRPESLTIREYHLLEAELFIAKFCKGMVCLGMAMGFLFVRVDDLAVAQGLALFW